MAKVLILVLQFLTFPNVQSEASQETESKNVLVLISYKATAPVASPWNQCKETVFKSENLGAIDINIEYLDLINFNDAGDTL